MSPKQSGLRRFWSDSASIYGVYILQLGIGIFSIPIYLNVYGETLYGIYLLSIGLASTLMFIDFGSGKALLRYTSEFLQDKDKAKYLVAAQTSLWITGTSCILVIALFTGLSIYQELIFEITGQYERESRILLASTGIYCAGLFLLHLSSATLKGLRIFYKRNVYALIEVFALGCLVLLVYLLEINILLLMAGQFALLLLSIFLDFYVLRKYGASLIAWPKFSLGQFDTLYRAEPWKYALDSFKLSVIAFFSQGSDKIVIGLFTKVKFVAVYTVVAKPYQVLKSLIGRGYVVLQPYYIKLRSAGAGKLQKFVADASLISSAALLAGALGGILAFPIILETWLGTSDYAQYYLYGQLLIGAIAIRGLATIAYQALYIMGKTAPLLKAELLFVSLNLFISVVLIQFIGFEAVIIGTVAQLTLMTAWMFFQMKHLASGADEHREVKASTKIIWRMYITSVLSVGLVVYTSEHVINGLSDAERVVCALGTSCLAGTIFVIIFYHRILTLKDQLVHYY